MITAWFRPGLEQMQEFPPIILMDGIRSPYRLRQRFEGIKTIEEKSGEYVSLECEDLDEVREKLLNESHDWKQKLIRWFDIDLRTLNDLNNLPIHLEHDGMTNEMYNRLKPGDLVCFGDQDLGVTNRTYINRWCRVYETSNSGRHLLVCIRRFDWKTRGYQSRRLQPFFIRNGVKHS